MAKVKKKQKLKNVGRTLKTLTFLMGLIFLAGAFFVFRVWVSYPLENIETHFPVLKRDPKKPLKAQVSWSHKRPWFWVSLRDISKPTIKAVQLSEDSAFFSHEGIDFHEIQESFERNWKEKEFARGGSTITQQVVKNVFLSSEKTLSRKLKEIILAKKLENTLEKNEILEVYFNIVEWGTGVGGVLQASKRYFNKHPSELGPKEGAFLAMLLPSPSRYSESFRQKKLTPYAKRRTENILLKLYKTGVISKEVYEVELQTPLSFETPEPTTDAPQEVSAETTKEPLESELPND